MQESDNSESESRPATQTPKNFFARLATLIRPDPADRDDIKAILDTAHQRQILDNDAYSMLSGALEVANQTVADIMVPRSKMIMLDIDAPAAQLLPEIIDSGHSRFPVYEGDRDNVVGILLAKDLLLTITNPNIELRALVRPPVFIPETKRLNVLLHDFRSSRNHLAIVIDEHGGTSGLVTMEDVLEQIVGEIEDEYDDDEQQTIFRMGNNSWRAMGITEIDDFNHAFGCLLQNDDYDTLGGWFTAELGRIPRRGDRLQTEGLDLTVVGADAKRVLWVHVQRETPDSSTASAAS